MFKKLRIPYLGLLPIILISAFLIKLMLVADVSLTSILGVVYSCIAYFVWGFVYAYLLNPAMVFFERLISSKKDSPKVKKYKRAGVIAFLYLLIAGLITLFIVAIVPTIRAGIREFVDNIPRYAANFEIWLADFTNSFDPTITEMVEQYAHSIFETLYNWLTGVMDISSIGDAVSSAVSVSTQVVLRAVFGIVVSIYYLYSKDGLVAEIKKLFLALFSEKTANAIYKSGRKINEIFQKFIVSRLLQSLIMFFLGLIVLIPLRVPLAPLVAIIIGVTNMIPYFGPWLGAIPCVLLALFIGGVIPALITVLFAVGVQILDNLIIGPKIMSSQVGISPLLVIAGVTIGGKFGGVLGMFLGVPLVAVFKFVFYDKFIENRLKEKNI
ncbi:MAG: AI-2E family transporter [Clostridia bacterium]|nr:AI-2E family transporter [Clostridia bacterium]